MDDLKKADPEFKDAACRLAAAGDYMDLKATAVHLYDTVHTLNRDGAWDKFESTWRLMFDAIKAAYELGYTAAKNDAVWGSGERLSKIMEKEF